MKKITLLLLLVFTTTLIFAEDVTLTETYANVVQTSAAAENTKWNGDYFEWTVYRLRRKSTDVFLNTTEQGGWYATPGYLYSSQPIEGGVKTLSIDWAQFGTEAGNTLRLMILIDGVAVDSILRNGDLGACEKQVYTNSAINSKKNAALSLNNTSYETATGITLAFALAKGRFLLGDITWTPYLWYQTKKATIQKGSTYTNTNMINNLDVDMDAPTYTSGNTSVAIVNPATGEVTGVNAGTTTITATSGLISTTYELTVDITSGTQNNNNGEVVVYPTNISDVLNIRIAEKDFTAKVYNQLGSLISEYINTNTISFSNIAAGIYFIRIQSKGKVDTIHKVYKR